MTLRQLPELLWVILVIVVMPLQAVFRKKAMSTVFSRSRPEIYKILALNQAILIIIMLAADLVTGRNGWSSVRAFLPRDELVRWVGLTGGLALLVWITAHWARKTFRAPPNARVIHMLPHTWAERPLFYLVSILAGVSEEFLYRGMCYRMLVDLLHSPWTAAALVTLGFAFAHGYQGLTGVVITGLYGVLNVVPVVATGSIVPPMIVHAFMDIWSGTFSYGFYRRFNLAPPE